MSNGGNYGRGRRRSHPQRHYLRSSDDTSPLLSSRPGALHEPGRRHDNRASIDEKLAQMEREEQAREERRRKAIETARMRVINSGLAVVQRGTETSSMLYPPKDTAPLVGIGGSGCNDDDGNTDTDMEDTNAMLAVATVVSSDAESFNDDNNVKDLPLAIEYDPDSKPPIYKNRRFRLYGALGCAVLMMVASVSIWLVVSQKMESSTSPEPPTKASPPTERDQIYRAIFAKEVGDQVYEPGTPHDMAADWIVNQDPMALAVDSSSLIQRYTMAFLYFHFSANGTKPWKSCNPPKEGDTKECILNEHSLGTNQEDYVYNPKPGHVRWLSDAHECDWAGVVCSDDARPVVYAIMLGKLDRALMSMR